MRTWIYLVLLFIKSSTGDSSTQDSLNIECPFPDGQHELSEGKCSNFTACDWTEGQCHMRMNSEAGYYVNGLPQPTARGFKLLLKKIDPSLTLFGDDISDLIFEVINHEDYHVQVKIYDNSASRYEVPIPLNLPETATENPLFSVSTSDDSQPFHFSIDRLGEFEGKSLFSTIGALSFENQFLQITTILPTTYLYGMGENTRSTLRHSFTPRDTYPIFSRDHLLSEGHVNEYGHHPYYININNETGEASSTLFYNSNAIEYSTFLLEDGTPALTLRAIGGIIDLHFFLGPKLEDVNKQYAKMIGLPAFPPYWSLGFQISRWGYSSTEHVREVRARTRAMAIPQDGQTLDIDYMSKSRDFTYDPVNWADLADLIEELHNDGIRLTLILDPALVVDFENYPAGQRGKESDVYIKWLSDSYIPPEQEPSWGQYMVGRVWPDDPVVFPDFLKPATQTWWADELIRFHQNLSFDAIWIDMNEPSNFGTNLGVFQHDLVCPHNTWDDPPYPTMMVRVGSAVSKRLSSQTLCMSGNQTNGSMDFLHYDVHSLYGWSETVATYKGLQKVFPEKRPVILSRSTFPGSGHYTSHWSGDNTALWSHLKLSVINMLEFNFFGIPMVGSDICGFNGIAYEEMCTRWMELGAFYPFSRNHNMRGTPDQDPAVWPEVAAISREVLSLRYRYLPYLYTLFFHAHVSGSSVVRPIFSQFLTDTEALDVDDQFLWGEGIMVAPVLSKGTHNRQVYFPEGNWYDLRTGKLEALGPNRLNISAPIETIPVYGYGGVILPLQEPALNTIESRKNPFGLTIALDSSMEAKGDLFWDDGEGIYVEGDSYYSSFSFSNNILNLAIYGTTLPVAELNFESFQFFGYTSSISGIEINGAALPSSDWSLDEAIHVLSVSVSIPLAMNTTVVLLE